MHVRLTYSREEFYRLVWTKPLSELGPELGMSDVALAKSCRRFNIPIPGRGHWAKVKAGKPSFQPPLAHRNFGEDDLLSFGRTSWEEDAKLRKEADDLLLAGELPSPPEFPETVVELQERASKAVGKVRHLKDLTRAHPALARIIRADGVKLEKARGETISWPWEERLFESPCGRRRAKLLDSIFQACARVGMRCSTSGNMPDSFEVSCPNGTRVSLKLDTPKRLADPEKHRVRPTEASEPLALHISWGWAPIAASGIQLTWKDGDAQRLEDQLSEIAAGVLVALEISQRDFRQRQHDNLVKRKEELIRSSEAERKRIVEEERLRIERLHAVITEKLLREADALRTAQSIRTYVHAVLAACNLSQNGTSDTEIEAWAAASLRHADSIDPVLSGAFLAPPDPVSSPVKPAPPANSARDRPAESGWHPNQKWNSR